jgi:hypothetical protein
MTYLTNVTSVDSTQPVNAQGCSDNSWNTSTIVGANTVMAYLEPLLSCTSWCNLTTSPLVIYRFSSVNNGIPTSYCYDTINMYVTNYSKTGYIIGFIMVGVAALAFFCGLWLRCEVNSEAEQKNQFGGVKTGDGPSQMRMNNY